jgi:hypothetical protein
MLPSWIRSSKAYFSFCADQYKKNTTIAMKKVTTVTGTVISITIVFRSLPEGQIHKPCVNDQFMMNYNWLNHNIRPLLIN